MKKKREVSSSDNYFARRISSEGDDNGVVVTTSALGAAEGQAVAVTVSGHCNSSSVVYGNGESRRMLFNVIVISFCFTLLFTAFNSMSNLQSSLNAEEGLGPYSLAAIHSSLVFSSMFLPKFLIQKFTAKWTLVVSMLGYVLYIAAQFYPRFGTLIPAAAVLGLSAAPLWSSKCTYLTHVGRQYAETVSDKSEVVIVRFFGIFFFAFQSSQIWGNLISSSILSSDNSTATEKDISICGINFCPSDVETSNATENSDPNIKGKVYMLAGIYLGCAILAAVIVAVLVDPLTRYGERDRDGGATSHLSGISLLSATFHQMIKPIQLLIIPITIWSGMEQGFFSSDFTQAYITCSWGVSRIGYIMICYGVCDTVTSIGFEPIVRSFGRVPVFTAGAILNFSVILTMFFWKPDPTTPHIFYAIAGTWGIADAIWQTQINALYGVLFHNDEEAAFSNYRLWESIGFITAYISTTQLCIAVKLYVLIAVLGFGMLGYFVSEIVNTRKNAREVNMKMQL